MLLVSIINFMVAIIVQVHDIQHEREVICDYITTLQVLCKRSLKRHWNYETFPLLTLPANQHPIILKMPHPALSYRMLIMYTDSTLAGWGSDNTQPLFKDNHSALFLYIILVEEPKLNPVTQVQAFRQVNWQIASTILAVTWMCLMSAAKAESRWGIAIIMRIHLSNISQSQTSSHCVTRPERRYVN